MHGLMAQEEVLLTESQMDIKCVSCETDALDLRETLANKRIQYIFGFECTEGFPVRTTKIKGRTTQFS